MSRDVADGNKKSSRSRKGHGPEAGREAGRGSGQRPGRGAGKRDGKTGGPAGKRPAQRQAPAAPAGHSARRYALGLLEAIMQNGQTFDEAVGASATRSYVTALDDRDRAFARLIVATTLRHHAELARIIEDYLDKPLPAAAARVGLILLSGAAQLLYLKAPPHAVISTSVDLTRSSRKSAHFDRLTNAVLRRVSETGAARLVEIADPTLNFPDWMLDGWRLAYGEEAARRIAEASLHEAALDITVKSDPVIWAERLEAVILPTGTLRRLPGGQVTRLAGFSEGAWWIQDAASALAAKILDAKPDERVLDVCAAPGGKTAQLATTGADVTALDHSEHRMKRLSENLRRLDLHAHEVIADAQEWQAAAAFDAILVDAPCTATGTIRRHPDILHIKRRDDAAKLAAIQAGILRNAARQTKPGGRLIYCTCSLEPAEGPEQIDRFLADAAALGPDFRREPITPEEAAGQADWITAAGDLRIFPFHLPHTNPSLSGIDGFYIARLVRAT